MIPHEIGLPGEIRAASLVVGRRGSRVWKLEMADGRTLALKYTTDDGESGQQQAPLLAAREAAVLALLDPPSVFGAVLFAAWAGVWPHEYGADDARALTVARIQASITDPRSLRPMPDGWPVLAGLLAIMLDPSPVDRPTMAEVARALRADVGGGP